MNRALKTAVKKRHSATEFLPETGGLPTLEQAARMGATASQSVLGRAVGIQKERGSFLSYDSGAKVMVTIHPSALLRLRTHEEREREFDRFVIELKSAKERAG